MDLLFDTLSIMTSGALGWLIILASLAAVAWALRMLWLGRPRRYVNFVLFTAFAGILGFVLAPGIDGGGHGSANYYLPLLLFFTAIWLLLVAALALMLGIPVSLLVRARPTGHEDAR